MYNNSPSMGTANGFKDMDWFVSNLASAINQEASAIRFYATLADMAPNSYRSFVTHAREDEEVHLRLFRRLYQRLTGTEPMVSPEETSFGGYKQGIETAFRNELDAAELYRNMYLSTKIRKVRDILFRAMTDEMEHAQRFSFLYFLP